MNLKVIITAFTMGTVPPLLWLWFWLKEDNNHPQAKGLLFLTFILGMLSVFFVLPLQKLTAGLVSDKNSLVVIWAGIEELIKYLAVFLIALKSPYLREPVDYPIYFITAALGFAALENTLFLIQPLTFDETTVSLMTGNLRFLGASLVHAVSSAIIGISIGLSFFENKTTKVFYTLIGIAFAISLHSVFNFFIIKSEGEDFLKVFGFLWAFTILIMLIFEKLRKMNNLTQSEA